MKRFSELRENISKQVDESQEMAYEEKIRFYPGGRKKEVTFRVLGRSKIKADAPDHEWQRVVSINVDGKEFFGPEMRSGTGLKPGNEGKRTLTFESDDGLRLLVNADFSGMMYD